MSDPIPVPPAAAPDVSAKPQISAVNAVIGEFTTMADFFVWNVFDKRKSVEIVFFNTGSATELVLFDKTAVDDPNDRPYALSWVQDDGVVISVVGHYQDFLDYNLA